MMTRLRPIMRVLGLCPIRMQPVGRAAGPPSEIHPHLWEEATHGRPLSWGALFAGGGCQPRVGIRQSDTVSSIFK